MSDEPVGERPDEDAVSPPKPGEQLEPKVVDPTSNVASAEPGEANEVKPLRRPLAVVLTLMAMAVFVTHLGITLVYLSPANLLKKEGGQFADRYMKVLFYQNWHLFSPEPGISTTKFAFRCYPEGGEWGQWHDPLVSLHEDFYKHRVGAYGKLIYVYRDLAIGLKQALGRHQRTCLERYPEDDPQRYLECAPSPMMVQMVDEPSFELAMRFTRTACSALIDPDQQLAAYTFKTLEFFPLKYSEREEGVAAERPWSKVVEIPYPIFEVER